MTRVRVNIDLEDVLDDVSPSDLIDSYRDNEGIMQAFVQCGYVHDMLKEMSYDTIMDYLKDNYMGDVLNDVVAYFEKEEILAKLPQTERNFCAEDFKNLTPAKNVELAQALPQNVVLLALTTLINKLEERTNAAA